MATKQKLFQKCAQCDGDKQVVSIETGGMVDCPYCNGKGHIYWGYLRIPEIPEEE